MTPASNEKKQRSLAALYRLMPTTELKRRIREGQLAAPAQLAAEAELQSRLSPDAPATEPPAAPGDGGQARLFQAAAGVLVSGALAWWVVSPELAAFVPLLVLPWVIAPAAKAFPRAGVVLGIFFAVLPVGLLAWAWMAGALVMQRGDFKPLGAIIAWFVLIAAFVICWALASMLLMGARHRGSWSGLHRKLEKLRAEQVDAIK